MLLIASALFSVVGTGLVLLYARRAGLIDVPNHRSSHHVPTPRGGGIALVATVIVVTVLTAAAQPLATLALPAATVVALTIVGWLDDKGPTPIALRLPVHVGCGVAVAILVNRFAPQPGAVNAAWIAWWILWTVASINIVNFMDGIDGMVAAQGVVYGLFLYALAPTEFFASRFGLIVAGACGGFLVWNWAPAKIFMGDAGSGPLGLLFAVGGALALQGALPALVFLPLFPLYFDALATLVVRLGNGERVSEAHRSHLYQRIVNSGIAHALVTSIYALAAAIGALVGLFAASTAGVLRGMMIVGYCVVIIAAWLIASARFPLAPVAAARRDQQP